MRSKQFAHQTCVSCRFLSTDGAFRDPGVGQDPVCRSRFTPKSWHRPVVLAVNDWNRVVYRFSTAPRSVPGFRSGSCISPLALFKLAVPPATVGR